MAPFFYDNERYNNINLELEEASASTDIQLQASQIDSLSLATSSQRSDCSSSSDGLANQQATSTPLRPQRLGLLGDVGMELEGDLSSLLAGVSLNTLLPQSR